MVSCAKKVDVFEEYQKEIHNEINLENNYKNENLIEKSERLILLWNNEKVIEEIQYYTLMFNELNILIESTDKIDNQFTNKFIDTLLTLCCNYSYVKDKFYIDLNDFENSKISDKDTALVNEILYHKSILINKESYILKNNLKILNQYIFEKILSRYEHIGWSYNRITFEILSKESIYFQNEKAYIIPSFIADYKDEKFDIFLFKENSDEYIMEKGVKKLFQNPVSYIASKEEGLHEIKGEIMVKQKGENIPIPFSFRYYVQAN